LKRPTCPSGKINKDAKKNENLLIGGADELWVENNKEKKKEGGKKGKANSLKTATCELTGERV